MNKDPIPERVLALRRHAQESLPEGVDWHPRTVEWWTMWGRTAQAEDFTESDWNFLLDTAVMHHRFWLGDVKLAAELRIRVAKFGATPEDRARLRIVFADADGKDERRSSRQSSARTRRGPLKAV